MSRHKYRNERNDDRDHHNGQEGYKFSFSGNNVNAVYELEHGRLKLERMDSDESWAFDGSTVTKTEYEHGRLEITTYADLDGDGIYTVSGKSYGAATTTPSYYTGTDDSYSSTSIATSYSNSYSTYTPPSISYHFDTLDGAVLSATRSVNGYERDVRLGRSESWEMNGDDVAKVRTKWNETETTLFTDDNSDGAYDRALDIEVKTQAEARHYEDNRFVLQDGSFADGATLQADDVISSQLEASRRGWKYERLDLNEDLTVTEIDGSIYIMKTETKRSGELEFKLFRDDDADGRWTEVAEGDANAPFLDDMGALDVIRLEDTGLLTDSYGIIA